MGDVKLGTISSVHEMLDTRTSLVSRDIMLGDSNEGARYVALIGSVRMP